MLHFLHNFPFFSILLSMFSGIICSVLKRKPARYVTLISSAVIVLLSAGVIYVTAVEGEPFVFLMGHFPAPWGNEIRAGILEAVMAFAFSGIVLLSLLGGLHTLSRELAETKENLFYVLINLMLSSLLALIYTNDLFTAYVFVEINTISACGLIMIRKAHHNLIAAVRYMIMSLVGSGLLLMGICMIYGLTGHLLMSNIQETFAKIVAGGSYELPIEVTFGLVSVGLAIKSALYPFHTWVPDAYGHSITSASSILSGLVSKGYILLLIKMIYRVFGFEIMANSRMIDILFLLGILGMIAGSVDAMQERDIRRMTANSSVAQIGYIYVGIGMGTLLGQVAAVFHILTHAITKPLLFLSASGLCRVSGDSKIFKDLTGSGYRNKLAGIGFTAGSLSMIGFPLTAGFFSKFLFAEACIGTGWIRMSLTIIALAVSTVLNAAYFMRTVIRIWTPGGNNEETREYQRQKKHRSTLVAIIAVFIFIVLNVVAGVFGGAIADALRTGLLQFS